MKVVWRFSILLFVSTISLALKIYSVPKASEEGNRQHWYTQNNQHVSERLSRVPNSNRAQNVIFFLGDGMGISSVTAGRIYKGQKRGASGEEEQLTFDKFPHVSLSKTYNLDYQTPDSAGTATAYLCGIKANFGTLGVDGRWRQGQCHNNTEGFVDSLMVWAQAAGKGTGIVTTTRVTHATPAGTYAHTGNRDWESSVPEICGKETRDIAYQLVHEAPGKNFKVVLGGGLQHFDNRSDKVDLINEWKVKEKNRVFVDNKNDLLKADAKELSALMGIFNSDHIPYYVDQSEEEKKVIPTLAEMTKKAIEVLEAHSRDGWVLLVEGGRIDQAHHLSRAGAALEELYQFDQAIEQALSMVNVKNTMVLVTADHSHTFTIGGYPRRGNIITGLVNDLALDNKTYTTLAYANGPGYRKSPDGSRVNETEEEVTNPKYLQASAVPKDEETHGAEDVAVFATGPWAHLFTGVNDQSFIPHAIAHAACLPNPGSEDHQRSHCNDKPKPAASTRSSASFLHFSRTLCLVLTLILFQTNF